MRNGRRRKRRFLSFSRSWANDRLRFWLGFDKAQRVFKDFGVLLSVSMSKTALPRHAKGSAFDNFRLFKAMFSASVGLLALDKCLRPC